MTGNIRHTIGLTCPDAPNMMEKLENSTPRQGTVITTEGRIKPARDYHIGAVNDRAHGTLMKYLRAPSHIKDMTHSLIPIGYPP